MTSATGLSVCYILASILLSIGSKNAAYGATAMVFIFQIFLGIGYLPIVSLPSHKPPVTIKTLIAPCSVPSHGSTLQRYHAVPPNPI